LSRRVILNSFTSVDPCTYAFFPPTQDDRRPNRSRRFLDWPEAWQRSRDAKAKDQI
jgi:hypothetical protein